jgi:hypothetical protein
MNLQAVVKLSTLDDESGYLESLFRSGTAAVSVCLRHESRSSREGRAPSVDDVLKPMDLGVAVLRRNRRPSFRSLLSLDLVMSEN